MERMLCEADRRMTCEQLKAHPVCTLFLLLLIITLWDNWANGSSSTESTGLQFEISTHLSFLILNQLPIHRTSQLMRLIKRTIYLLVQRMGMMQRRIWLSWVIRMSPLFLLFLPSFPLFFFSSFLLRRFPSSRFFLLSFLILLLRLPRPYRRLSFGKEFSADR